MPEAIGLVYCTVLRVYILPEDSADSEHPVYLRISMYYWRAGANSLKRRVFVRRASAHASILRASRRQKGTENVVPVKLLKRGSSERLVEVLPLSHST